MDDDTLKPSRSGAVCMTCNHFRYAVGEQCQTLIDLSYSSMPDPSRRAPELQLPSLDHEKGA